MTLHRRRPGPGSPRGWACVLLLSTCALAAHAVSPLTARFSASTQARMLEGLAHAGLPEVAHHSVLTALLGGLGFEPAHATINYAQPYAHLPLVKGRVVRLSPACARVDARAWLPSEDEAQGVVVEGTYCLEGAAEWAATRQIIQRRRP